MTTPTSTRPAPPTRSSTSRCPTPSSRPARYADAASCAAPASWAPASRPPVRRPRRWPTWPCTARRSAAPGPALRVNNLWLAGDHHIHTQYSPDAQYRVVDQVQHANAYGLDWMVITDHGSVAHAKIGVDKVNPDIVAARERFDDDTLVFQGLEWNIPAAEHGTVFVHPGPQRGRRPQGVRERLRRRRSTARHRRRPRPTRRSPSRAWTSSPTRSPSAASQDALFLANHPARKGIDSPHEIRGWRDASPRIAVGMEGAPGHQAAGIPTPLGPGSRPRLLRQLAQSADCFAGYPLESYRTWGGFDWMTATVGGLWDSLLAEGKPWWITANSDSHKVYLDDSVAAGPGQRLRHQRPLRRPGPRPAGREHRQRRLLARLLQPDPRRRGRLLLRRRSWTACGPAGSGSTTAA